MTHQYMLQVAREAQTYSLMKQGRVMERLGEIAAKPSSWRREALDSHLVVDIEDTEPREELDEAIWHLGLIELGIQFGIAATPDRKLGALLDVPEIRRYAFQFYPQLLPEMLYQRLKRWPAIPEGTHARPELFQQTLGLCARLDAPRIDLFLTSLDDFDADDDSVPDRADLLERLRDTKAVVHYLAWTGPAKKPVDIACLGFFDFMRWAEDLHALLRQAPTPLAASAIWHQFGYWMNLLGGRIYGATAAALEGVADSLLSWTQPENGRSGSVETKANPVDQMLEDFVEPDPASMNARKALLDMCQRLRTLTSPLYAAPLFQWNRDAQNEYWHARAAKQFGAESEQSTSVNPGVLGGQTSDS